MLTGNALKKMSTPQRTRRYLCPDLCPDSLQQALPVKDVHARLHHVHGVVIQANAAPPVRGRCAAS